MTTDLLVGLIFFAAGLALAPLNFVKSNRKEGAILVAMAMCGAMLIVTSIAVSSARVNEIYSAADFQGISVTTKLWQQVPQALRPCKVTLRFDDDNQLLFIVDTGELATPQTLRDVCKGGILAL